MKANKILKITLTLIALMGLQSVHAAYTGAGIGYMIDAEEELLTAHIGFQMAERGSLTHNIEFEIGYVESSEMGVDVDILPLMLNYRAVNTGNDSYDLYFGVGIGTSNVDVNVSGTSDDDNVFTAQALVGIDFKVSANTSIRLGYRYVYMDTVKLFGYDLDDLDDNVIELGITVKF
jgi:opacity protein-like surface antigen